jgi:hypothetical protein
MLARDKTSTKGLHRRRLAGTTSVRRSFRLHFAVGKSVFRGGEEQEAVPIVAGEGFRVDQLQGIFDLAQPWRQQLAEELVDHGLPGAGGVAYQLESRKTVVLQPFGGELKSWEDLWRDVFLAFQAEFSLVGFFEEGFSAVAALGEAGHEEGGHGGPPLHRPFCVAQRLKVE